MRFPDVGPFLIERRAELEATAYGSLQGKSFLHRTLSYEQLAEMGECEDASLDIWDKIRSYHQLGAFASAAQREFHDLRTEQLGFHFVTAIPHPDGDTDQDWLVDGSIKQFLDDETREASDNVLVLPRIEMTQFVIDHVRHKDTYPENTDYARLFAVGSLASPWTR